MEAQALRRRLGREQPTHVPFMLRMQHIDVDGLALRKRAHEFDHGGLDAGEHAGPTVQIVRPRQPRRFVRRPLRRQAITLGTGPIILIGSQTSSTRETTTAQSPWASAEGAHHNCYAPWPKHLR